MERGEMQQIEHGETEAKQYEPPVVVATYSLDELRSAAAVSGVSLIES